MNQQIDQYGNPLRKVSFQRFLAVLLGSAAAFVVAIVIVFVLFQLLTPEPMHSYIVQAPFSNLLFLLIMFWLLNTFVFRLAGTRIPQAFSLSVEKQSLARQIWIGFAGWFWMLTIVMLCRILIFIVARKFEGQFNTALANEVIRQLQLKQTTLAMRISIFFNVCIATVLVEECLFRGYIYNWLRARMGFGQASLLSAIAFGTIHGIAPSLLIYVPMGFVLAAVYQRSGALISPIVTHCLWNFACLCALLLLAK